ncbi:MAG: UDP-N-acetylmuramoyl-L-alanyl-D-glutamate--2,6-diaminopimelate ligase [Hyphomicrobiales bacterium]|nr:UDP-N-acetylmuramoyl-L-alanyl-D-glutamate--2,6-diaminopimelate ligase [Hyphomicrobiales bacterium]
MKLKDLLGAPPEGEDWSDVTVTGVTADSREVKPGYLFAAMPGVKADGMKFIRHAIEKGASAILIADSAAQTSNGATQYIRDANPRRRFALIAGKFYDRQPETVVAVTGTNGKTSVASFVRQIWEKLGRKAASLGTVGLVSPLGEKPLDHTTPDPAALHAMLAELADGGVHSLALEASSHGLEQHRLDGVKITAAAFTNITRDHLDYHKEFAAYFQAKLRLFELLPPGAPAVINADQLESAEIAGAADARRLDVFTVGRLGAGIKLVSIGQDGLSQRLTVRHAGKTYKTLLPLAGDFQASNALVAAGIALKTGGDPNAVFAALETLQGAKGRLELAGRTAKGAPVFIDYAHTPDALEKALQTLRPYTTGKLAVVFGCGGDRDRGKRPQMGAIASRLADVVYVTDDNPRSEDPGSIRAAILAESPRAREVGDRMQAIAEAVAALGVGDALLVAGKGHETGQIVGAEIIPYSDHEAVRTVLAATAPYKEASPAQPEVAEAPAVLLNNAVATAILPTIADDADIEQASATVAKPGESSEPPASVSEPITGEPPATAPDALPVETEEENSDAVETSTTSIDTIALQPVDEQQSEPVLPVAKDIAVPPVATETAKEGGVEGGATSDVSDAQMQAVSDPFSTSSGEISREGDSPDDKSHLLWAFTDILSATKGSPQGARPEFATGVSIDSRTLAPGDLFVAIKGERMDGHDYVTQVLRQDAAMAIVSKDYFGAAGPLVRVPDPLEALIALGQAARGRTDAKIIAVTGSVGKTSSKEMLRLALRVQGAAHASEKSYNNLWGVPLSLARMPQDSKFGIFEIGMNHSGEIAPLTRMVRPHIAIVTNVAPVHLEFFSGVDAIAEAKAEIFQGLEPDGVAIINRDLSQFGILELRAMQSNAARIVTFGEHFSADARLVTIDLLQDRSRITANIFGQTVVYDLGAPGRHLAMNSLAVLCAIQSAGGNIDLAAASLAAFQTLEGRGVQTRFDIAGGAVLLIDESYNANPASMSAAIAVLGQLPRPEFKRRLAVLGDMLELGHASPKLHADLAQTIDAADVDVVFACGPHMRSLFDTLPAAKRGAYAETAAELKSALLSAVESGDAVMVKGSLGSKTGLLVTALKNDLSARARQSGQREVQKV